MLGKAGSLVPHLARNLTQYRGQIDPVPRGGTSCHGARSAVSLLGCGRRPEGRRRGGVIITVSTDVVTWVSETIPIAGVGLRLSRAGAGPPVLVLHHDIGAPHPRAFHDALAGDFTLLAPSHPGYDGSDRPEWMRSVRDLAVVYQRLLGELGVASVSLVGLGFGGWIAAEMATMPPRAVRRLGLVGGMGI